MTWQDSQGINWSLISTIAVKRALVELTIYAQTNVYTTEISLMSVTHVRHASQPSKFFKDTRAEFINKPWVSKESHGKRLGKRRLPAQSIFQRFYATRGRRGRSLFNAAKRVKRGLVKQGIEEDTKENMSVHGENMSRTWRTCPYMERTCPYMERTIVHTWREHVHTWREHLVRTWREHIRDNLSIPG